jgi:hypothetical protein
MLEAVHSEASVPSPTAVAMMANVTLPDVPYPVSMSTITDQSDFKIRRNIFCLDPCLDLFDPIRMASLEQTWTRSLR